MENNLKLRLKKFDEINITHYCLFLMSTGVKERVQEIGIGAEDWATDVESILKLTPFHYPSDVDLKYYL